MKRGAIIIHGLTGTPATVAPITSALASSGFKTVSPLLPGHGTSLENLSRTSMEEWCDFIFKTYDLLKKDVDEVYCVGISLGALLTIRLAMERHVKKIACLGLPLKLTPLVEKLLIPISHFPLVSQILKYSKKDWSASVADPLGREIYKSASYPKIPVHSVWELQRLQKAIMKNIRKFNTPTLLIHSKNDKVAPPINVSIFSSLAVRVRPEILMLARSEHVVTLDYEAETVTKEIVKSFSQIYHQD